MTIRSGQSSKNYKHSVKPTKSQSHDKVPYLPKIKTPKGSIKGKLGDDQLPPDSAER